ncbi:MAG: hypothetical protein HY898_00395 [Deltaproteobacteria bacterium]|nr:hypothetical protein [Deltaproteobacteria bacterium]
MRYEQSFNRVRATLLVAATAALVLGAGCSQRELPGDSVRTDAAPFAATGSRPAGATGSLESKLFPPELIMENQGAAGITPAQKQAILKEVDRAQSEVMRLQWDLNGEKEQLSRSLDAERVEEGKALEAASKIMALEDKIKSTHLQMLIRIKNQLSSTQQAALQAARGKTR